MLRRGSQEPPSPCLLYEGMFTVHKPWSDSRSDELLQVSTADLVEMAAILLGGQLITTGNSGRRPDSIF